jgi:site-specific DNA recombinase
VVDQIKTIGGDRDLVAATVGEMQRQVAANQKTLASEQSRLGRQLQRDEREFSKLTSRGKLNEDAVCRLADLGESLRTTKLRLGEIAVEMATLEDSLMPADEVATSLAAFDPLWESLSPRERTRILKLLVERVDFDGDGGSVSVTFHPTGIRALDNLTEVMA